MPPILKPTRSHRVSCGTAQGSRHRLHFLGIVLKTMNEKNWIWMYHVCAAFFAGRLLAVIRERVTSRRKKTARCRVYITRLPRWHHPFYLYANSASAAPSDVMCASAADPSESISKS